MPQCNRKSQIEKSQIRGDGALAIVRMGAYLKKKTIMVQLDAETGR